MKTRGRPKKLTDDIEKDIADLKLQHKKWTAHEIQGELSVRMEKRIKKSRPELPDKDIQGEVKEQLPGLSTIQKYIKKIKPNLDTPLPKDKPFCLGALVNPEYNIPPEALPMVLKVWAMWANCNGEKDGFTYTSSFSIRDALWVSRLSSLFNDPEAIWGFASWYSVRERAYEVIDKDVDTTDLDTELLKNFKPATTESKRKTKGGTP